ncbi:bifunctional DNA primase/polymerase [Longispora sp. NPDC051575]|uniref:bifunctional DNA primase/polymerase n=1 Tax=Longispora sp. NPDC051575 TaxID=3154943 RepID=UPI003447B939
MTTTTGLLGAALAAAERGWHVFPLRPNDKPPAVKDWEARATIDPDRIRRCWSAGAFNVGIACGPSGLLVVDLDMPKPDDPGPIELHGETCRDGADVFTVVSEHAGHPTPVETFIVDTTRGGQHHYYRHPAGPELRNTAGRRGSGLGWLVDTRGHGGYVVAPGSVVNGKPYSVRWDVDPVALPGWLAGLLAPRPLPAPGPITVTVPDGRQGAYLRAAVERTMAHVRTAPPGTRNATLYGAAKSLGELVAGGELTEPEVTYALSQAAAEVGQRSAETRRTIRSGLLAGARNPRSVAA